MNNTQMNIEDIMKNMDKIKLLSGLMGGNGTGSMANMGNMANIANMASMANMGGMGDVSAEGMQNAINMAKSLSYIMGNQSGGQNTAEDKEHSHEYGQERRQEEAGTEYKKENTRPEQFEQQAGESEFFNNNFDCDYEKNELTSLSDEDYADEKTPKVMRILNAAIPFLDSEYQKNLFLAVKLMEMNRSYEMNKMTFQAQSIRPAKVTRREDILKAVRSQLSGDEQQRVDVLLKILEVKKLAGLPK